MILIPERSSGPRCFLPPDDGGYTGGGLPDEFKIATLRLSCDIRDDNDITVTVVWFEEVVTDPNIAAVKVSFQFDDQTKRDEAWLVGKSSLGTFCTSPARKTPCLCRRFPEP